MWGADPCSATEVPVVDGDWQVGGALMMVERLLQALRAAKGRQAAFRRLGKEPPVIRILQFGDSYQHCDDTWLKPDWPVIGRWSLRALRLSPGPERRGQVGDTR